MLVISTYHTAWGGISSKEKHSNDERGDDDQEETLAVPIGPGLCRARLERATPLRRLTQHRVRASFTRSGCPGMGTVHSSRLPAEHGGSALWRARLSSVLVSSLYFRIPSVAAVRVLVGHV